MLSPSKNAGARHQGLLIDFDYAFVIGGSKSGESVVDSQGRESAVDSQSRENTEAVVQSTQEPTQNREVLLHRTVRVLICRGHNFSNR
jgi:hypothetical protein